MRVIVFFDLPTISSENLREYRKFRKFLISEGFVMMQESVYTKLALNSTASGLIKERVRLNRPKEGLVEMLVITEKQFSSMEYVTGSKIEEVENSEKRLIVL